MWRATDADLAALTCSPLKTPCRARIIGAATRCGLAWAWGVANPRPGTRLDPRRPDLRLMHLTARGRRTQITTSLRARWRGMLGIVGGY